MDEMDINRALNIIKTFQDDPDEAELVLSAWQYLYDSEAYLELPAPYQSRIEWLLDNGSIE